MPSARPPSQNDLGSRPRIRPPQFLVANNGRRYVFSQPILDHTCTGTASHLEHSRPGACGRRVSPAVDTTTWHSETPPLPQSRSSIAHSKTFTFPPKKALCVSSFSQPSRFTSTVALSACCHQLCLAPFVPCSVFYLFLSPLDFQPFPPVPAVPSPCTTHIQ